MRTLFYGSGRTPIRIDDHVLAHLKAVITTKLRRGESFLLSWRESAQVGNGRSSVWIHPSCDLHYKFDGGTPPALDPGIIVEMTDESMQPRGIELVNVSLARSPHQRAGDESD
ncbi:hypothetical protein E3T26_05110 [Cryobacterium sp. TMT1-21]|uniref:DUF7882 domain-containing protein n=1 Tax=Cryobacterium shii TaxID=1259235 RepID=A0AAQ2HEQ6_9MICO|nr:MULTISPECIES: hypothetical protein [Cryobacterium]TFC42291.1 hypothetical protein E3O49_14705 [Cryobacterium shii]TFC85971.1 hypothetical protein E3T24_07185 [Cryobacterium sp. TmT2-59]TFD13710.1 hypothetical protein E3T42_13690 [Cryobacterium sp. TMT4-10]TFD15925.1 hypothetical protein E3T26_05110 [Cryobacterium sp. TMT1-21]TFD19773.1 hypothetical protein E3T32_10210 [Cryobacterium sp. TMT2-23]